MEPILFLVLAAILVAGFAGLFFMLRKGRDRSGDQALLMLQNQLNELSRMIDSKVFESSKLMQYQTSEISQNMQKIIREVTEQLVKVNEGQRQVVSVTEQLRNIQDILKNPKQRGALGEHLLEISLRNVLPPGAYQMQFRLQDGVVADAVIFLKDKALPIDSKFSLENYNRMVEARDQGERQRFEKIFLQDLKTRIDETAKYVKPQFGTTDVAFMYIPGEAVYSDLVENRIGDSRNLIEYAAEKHVTIVSPTLLVAYLQTVFQGIREQQFQESIKKVIKWMEDFRRHIASYEVYMKKLGSHLGTTVSAYNTAYRELGKVDKDVLRITGKSAEIESVVLAQPEESEKE